MPLQPECTSSATAHRISGPLLDRIDIHVEVPAVQYQDICQQRAGEPSTAIRERVSRPARSSKTASPPKPQDTLQLPHVLPTAQTFCALDEPPPT